MSYTPETSAAIELPSADEVAAYLQATTFVLTKSGLLLDGLSQVHYGSKGQLSPAVGGGLTMTADNDNMGFRMRWHAQPYELQGFGQYLDNDQGSYIEVKRQLSRHGQADYQVAWGQRQPRTAVRRLQPKTLDEQLTAEAVFVTVASDFKAVLSKKLGDHTELLDGIEWNAANILRRQQAERSRKGRSWLGKLGLPGK